MRSIAKLLVNTVKERNLPRFSRLTLSKSLTTQTSGGNEKLTKDASGESETHFGFEKVPESEKEKKVRKVFEDVAASYDLMNDVMSIGIHRLWKDIFIERMGPTRGIKLLDLAGGTGDIAFRCIKYLKNTAQDGSSDHTSKITVVDINEQMLKVGKSKAERLGFVNEKFNDINIEWVCADAEKLPFPDNSFSACSVAFGVRNCTHIDKVLEEAYRVLIPGGRFMCLEFSHLTNKTLQWLYDQYSFQIIPPMGQIIAGQWESYQYLVESIRKFPQKDEFKAMIERAGFMLAQYEDLTFGMVSIHSGFKIV